MSSIIAIGLSIERTKIMSLNDNFLEIMYKNIIQKHFYSNLAVFMKSGPCMFLLITGVDAVQRMNQLKHMLREKHEEGWIELTDQDLKLWHANSHPNQTTLNIKLVAANLIHVCDSEEESHRCAELIFNT